VSVVGAVAYYNSRRGSDGGIKGLLGGGSLGRAIDQRKAAGMTLEHHRDARMSIKKRVGIIQDLVWSSVRDPRMRKLALQITSRCRDRDAECEARAIHDWTKRNIRYTGDVAPIKMGRNGPVEGVDLFQSAYRTVEFGGGDCDDHSVLNATLLALNGITPKLRITAAKGQGRNWGHIYTMAGMPKNTPKTWKALDTTLPHGRYGTEAPYGEKIDFAA
jgi:hypothetical protein